MKLISKLSINKYFLLFILILVSIWSGLGSGWIDRENYNEMFFNFSLSNSFLENFIYAKDAVLYILFLLAKNFYNEPMVVFTTIIFIGLLAKYYAVAIILPNHIYSFFLIYLIFLSPALEFAAIRAGMAIGFLMLAVAYQNKQLKFLLLSMLAIASHMTIVIPIILAFRPINRIYQKNLIIVSSFIIITIIGIGEFWLDLFPQGMGYVDNSGSLMALALPTVTLIITILIYKDFDRLLFSNNNILVYEYLNSIKPIIYGLIATSVGVLPLSVIATTRFLEVSWVLLLLPMLVLFLKSYINLLGAILLLLYLTWLNMTRATWAPFLPFS
jgi:hypothetical protein